MKRFDFENNFEQFNLGVKILIFGVFLFEEINNKMFSEINQIDNFFSYEIMNTELKILSRKVIVQLESFRSVIS